jgi:hypothetical protein
VAKGVLALARNRRAPRPLHELLPLEPVQHLLRIPARDPADALDRAEPEHLPDDRGILQQRLLFRGQRVESRRDDSLHRLR